MNDEQRRMGPFRTQPCGTGHFPVLLRYGSLMRNKRMALAMPCRITKLAASLLTHFMLTSPNLLPLVDKGVGMLFPPACVFCAAPVPKSGQCCAACSADIRIISPDVCLLCGRPLPHEVAPGPCGACLRRSPPQSSTVSLYAYSGPVRDALLAWKLGSQEAGLDWLVQAASQRLCELFQPGDMLIPVPMPLARMRKYAKHHAADLCRRIATTTGVAWNWRLLRRQGKQPRQSTLSGQERRRNLRGAFVLDSHQLDLAADSKRLWVVDDIHTTGATLRFAARALKPLGREVHAFALARVLTRE